MKKFIFALLLSIFLIPGVKADTLTFNVIENYDIYIENESLFEEQSNQLIDYYNTNLKDTYDYYFITYSNARSGDKNINALFLYCTNSINFNLYTYIDDIYYNFDFLNSDLYYINNEETVELAFTDASATHHLFSFSSDFTNLSSFNFVYYSNFSIIYDLSLIKASVENYTYDTLAIANFYGDSVISVTDSIPLLKELLKYSSFEEYESNNNFNLVNLDNYEQVILILKDYSKTEAFESKLQVKGMIGITPVYEFGTTEKESVTDRCNISYSDFTDYRFFILENDLINNAIYYVKGCESGSSFKYDSTIFDITYVTADNVNDPVITFGGNTYHVIPFNKLNTTANSNEENNFVPGASEQFEPGKYLSSFWNSLTTLMGLVTKFFNTLPIEIRAISITAFFTAITLGVIKFIKS